MPCAALLLLSLAALSCARAWGGGVTRRDVTDFDQGILHIDDQVNRILSPLSADCTQGVMSAERECFAEYLLPYSDLARETRTHDYSSEFERKFCCGIWKWFDCTRLPVQRLCPEQDSLRLRHSMRHSVLYQTYCEGYEYGSAYCWILPLWAILLVSICLLLLLTGASLLLCWYCNPPTRHSRPYRYRRAGKATRINHA